MGFLDKMRGREGDSARSDGSPTAPGGAGDAGDLDDLDAVEEIGTRRLTVDEEAALEATRAGYPAHGIDPADLDTIAAAFDRALDRHDEDTSAVVEVLAAAVGDHLVAAGGYRWVVSTDPFGTDLAVAPPRRGVPVVARMLVATRWMSRERGWVPGVVGHLARAGNS